MSLINSSCMIFIERPISIKTLSIFVSETYKVIINASLCSISKPSVYLSSKVTLSLVKVYRVHFSRVIDTLASFFAAVYVAPLISSTPPPIPGYDIYCPFW